MNSREELIKRLREAVSSDHARGCEGRQYACDCGHDLMIEGLLEMAADEIERNAVAQRPLDREAAAALLQRLRQYNAAHLAYILSHDEAVDAILATVTSTVRNPIENKEDSAS